MKKTDHSRPYAFSKLVPSGNPTILLHKFSDETTLPFISSVLMDSLHVGAEQVGALYHAPAGRNRGSAACSSPGIAGADEGEAVSGRLQMMGGEFCVNATRCAAMMLSRQGRLRVLSVPGLSEGAALGGLVAVSGMSDLVPVLVGANRSDVEKTTYFLAEQGDTATVLLSFAALSVKPSPPLVEKAVMRLRNSFSLYCAAALSFLPGTIGVRELERGVHLVSMPGISHVLVDEAHFPFPAGPASGDDWRRAAFTLRERAGVMDAPASGVVWYRQHESVYRIQPAVAVAATNSEHMESACGSASLALAAYVRLGMEGPFSLTVTQPSGMDLTVHSCLDGEAWIGGEVRLVAEGMAYV